MPNTVSPSKANVASDRERKSTQRAAVRAPVSASLARSTVQRALSTPRGLPKNDILQLQRLIGNRAVADLLSRQALPSGGKLGGGVTVGPEGGAVSPDLERTIRRAQSGGQPVPDGIRRKVEDHTGQRYQDVRIHTGQDAEAVNGALGARASTHGKHIYLARNESPHDLQLMAHELTHVTQQTGTGIQRLGKDKNRTIQHQMPAARISTKRRLMYLDFVRMKRQNEDLGRIIKKKLGMRVNENRNQTHDTYGHWWTEIGNLRDQNFTAKESYGWWPKDGAPGSFTKVFKGVEGALNQEGPNSTHDPHEGDNASVEFHPAITVDPEQETYDQIRTRVTSEIRQFASGYKGKWHWKLGWGKNCHTFQQALKTKVGLHYKKAKSWLIDPKVEEEKREEEAEQQDREQAKQEVLKTYTIPSDRSLEQLDAQGKRYGSGVLRGGNQVGATGKMIPHRFPSGLQTFLVEYISIEDGYRVYVTKEEWEGTFNEPYPQAGEETTSSGGPENLGTGSGGNSNLILQLPT